MRGPVAVTVPATSANLGPGFDSLGLALELRDFVTAEVIDEPTVRVDIEGEGHDDLPRDASHLIAVTVLRSLSRAGFEVPGLHLTAVNRIPHGRGLGSSAAAIVAGVALAWALSGGEDSPISLDQSFDVAVDLEGHPDNVAPALLGGLTIAWPDSGTSRSRAVTLPVHSDVRAVVCIPSERMSTKAARGLLPESVSHADAAITAARSALLVHALTRDPSLLFEATVDVLHQPFRCAALPHTGGLITRLRDDGLAAVLSGSGPTALVLCGEGDVERVRALAGGFDVRELQVAPEGVLES